MVLNNFNSGVDTSFSSKLNSNFEEISNRDILFQTISTSNITSSSYVTAATLSTSSLSGSSEMRRVEYVLYGTIGGADTTGEYQLLTTFNDLSTSTLSVGSHSSPSSPGERYTIFTGYANYDKGINKIELQIKRTTGSGYANVESSMTGTTTPVTELFYSYIRIT